MDKYKIVNGTSYKVETPTAVINILEQARQNKTRIRVFYGDTKTGCDWCEINETIGTIGRSTGSIKIPLLIKHINSFGGGSILDDCIIKITIDKKTVYQNENYNIPNFEIVNGDMQNYAFNVVNANKNEIQRRCKNLVIAQREIQFLQGERNLCY